MKKACMYILLAIALSVMLAACAPYYYYPNDYADYYYYPSTPEYDFHNYYQGYPYPYPYRFYLYYNYDTPTYSYEYPSSRYYNYRPY